MSLLARRFRNESCRYLRDVYLPRLERALERLPAEDLWWRPAPGRLSVGNILLHLNGNVREWILAGLDGADLTRHRDAEFAATDGPDRAALLEDLRATVRQAVAVIGDLDDARLEAAYTIQGDEIDGQSAIYHVVEHFGYHTGQAVWIAKARGE